MVGPEKGEARHEERNAWHEREDHSEDADDNKNEPGAGTEQVPRIRHGRPAQRPAGGGGTGARQDRQATLSLALLAGTSCDSPHFGQRLSRVRAAVCATTQCKIGFMDSW